MSFWRYWKKSENTEEIINVSYFPAEKVYYYIYC